MNPARARDSIDLERTVIDTPLVSIVTPIHNDADVLVECAESVLGQTYDHWEYTIVDNASTDETSHIAAEYVRRDPRINYVRHGQLVGSVENYNRAFNSVSASSAYCIALAADDWLFPECITRMVEVAERSHTIGMVSSYRLAGTRVDLTGLPYDQNVFDGHAILRSHLLDEFSVLGSPSAMLFRSSIVRESHAFLDCSYAYHSDTEAAYRVLSRNAFGYVHQVLTYSRRQPTRHLMAARRMNTREAEILRFLLVYGPSILSPEEYRLILRRRLWWYGTWHARQLARVSWLRDPEFFKVHGLETDAMLAAGGDDPEVRAAVALVKMLLARGRWTRRAAATSGGTNESKDAVSSPT